jgi:hypothetical protein
VQRLGYLERLDRAAWTVDAALAREEPAVEEHSHRLHGIQRHAFGPLENPGVQVVGEAGDEAVEQFLHRGRRERLERQCRRVAPDGAEARSPFGELRPREREHEERMGMRPLEQVLDEVEQGRVGPLQVLEDEHDRAPLGEALEEEPPGREEVLPVGRRVLREPEQMGEARLEPRALARVLDSLLEHRAELGDCFLRRVLLGDQRPHSHHLCQRPVGDAVAVRETAAAVPEHLVQDPVEVLLELPREARLADAGDADDRDEVRLTLLRRAVEVFLDQAQLACPAHERRLELARRPSTPADRGDPERPK